MRWRTSRSAARRDRRRRNHGAGSDGGTSRSGRPGPRSPGADRGARDGPGLRAWRGRRDAWRPRWSAGVTTSQVRSGIQRYPAGTSERQRVPAGDSGTKISERNFRRRGPSAPPASSGRRRRAPQIEVRSNSGHGLSKSTERRWESCEQFLYLIKTNPRSGGPKSPEPDGDAGVRTRTRVFSCPGCVLRGIGAPPRTFRTARMQPNHPWRWRDLNPRPPEPQ